MVGDPLDDAPPRRLTRSPDPERERASVLIVEPDVRVGRKLRAICAAASITTLCQDFEGGRTALEQDPPTLLITNLRLESYNGLHLVLLNQTMKSRARCIVHTDRPDFLLAAEALMMGAFFERTERLYYSVIGYLWGALPAADRRDPARLDRRTSFRGGRRASDVDQVAS